MRRFRLAPLLSLSMVILFASHWVDQAMGRSCSDIDLGEEAKCDCQRWGTRKRIVGGQETNPNQYPFQAFLLITFGKGRKKVPVSCGGTIISSNWVLTAGHCVKDKTLPGKHADSIEVRVGEHIRSRSNETEFMKKYKTEQFILHENYRATRMTLKNDIALVRLDDPITFNEGVGPACLPLNFEDTDFDGDEGMAVGWGREGFKGPASDVLEDIEMDIYSGEKCSRKFRWGRRNVNKDQLCGYNKGGNVCSGDSGGPLVYTDDGNNYVVGVTSFVHGKKCDKKKYPGVFTRVTSYIDWILENTEEEFCSP